MTDLAKLVVKLEAETSKYQAELEKANNKLRSFQRSTNDLVNDVGKKLLAVFAVENIIEWGKHIFEAAAELPELSKKTGISVEALGRLQYAAKLTGVEVEGLGTGLRKFNVAISEAAGNAKSDAAVAFKAMGVSLRDSNGQLRPTSDLLSDVATKFEGYKDGANKVAIATALFGKAGADLIPLLDEGGAGIKRFGDQAEQAGAVLGGDTAEAANEFKKKLGLVGAGVTGVGNQILKDLLPALNNLTDAWDTDSNRASAFANIASGISTIFKSVTAGAIIVASAFQQLGTVVGALYASQNAFLHGDFKGGIEVLKAGYHDIVDNVSHDIGKVVGLFKDSPLDAAYLKEHAPKPGQVPKVLPDAPNISGLKAANTELERALAAQKRLLELDQNFKEQAATFDLGEAAATKYRLTLGSLSDDVATAGKKGQELRTAIIADAAAFEHLKNIKEISDALKEINVQIEEFKGNTVEAALGSFDKSNEELVKKLRQEGDQAGQDQLATLRALVGEQAEYNKLQLQAEQIESDLSILEEKIQQSRANGSITSLQADQQTSAARAQARDDLQGIYDQQKKIADESGNPQMIQGVKQFGASISQLGGQVDIFGQRARQALEGSLGTFFEDSIKNIHNLGEAFGNFLNDLAGMLVKFAAQQFAQKLLGSLFSGGSGSASGGILSSIGQLFGGGRAGGGPVEEGMAYKVNENTPRSEWFVPSTRGSIVPASKMGGMNVTQNISVMAQAGGSVSRATLLQTGSAAARGLAQAQRRNG